MDRSLLKGAIFLLSIAMMIVTFASCAQSPSQTYYDGYYTAEAAEKDDYGWKEYITICINGNSIVTVEYNAKNASGFIKSWDMDYMRIMNATDGTYPNEYTREYAVALLNKQDPAGVDAVSGATNSHKSFRKLAEAALAKAKEGDKTVAFVDLQSAE